MAKKIPQRMCVVCRRMLPKLELTRLIQTEAGLVADASGKRQGRGLYLCMAEDCQVAFFNLRNLSKLQGRKVELEEAEQVKIQLAEARTIKAMLTKKKEQRIGTEEKRSVRIVKVKAKTETGTETESTATQDARR